MSTAASGSNQKQSLNDQLKAKYRLNSEPFGGVSRFFYQGAQRQHNLETLRHLVNFGDMVLVVTGESGSGKTTLIAELCKQGSDDVTVLTLKPSLVASPRKLVEALCKRLDLVQIDGEQPSRTMDRIIQHCSHADKRQLLVVDDAQKVSKDTFRLLMSTFKDLGSDAGVSLLLAGRPDVMKQLTSEGVDPLHCGWMHQIQLKPFSQEEAVTYINLKLIRAGAASEPVLSESQKRALHELGKGCPGRINRTAPGVLLDTFVSPERKKAPGKGVSGLLLGIAVALVLSFLMIGYQYGFFALDEGERATESVVVPRSDDSINIRLPLPENGGALDEGGLTDRVLDEGDMPVRSLYDETIDVDQNDGMASVVTESRAAFEIKASESESSAQLDESVMPPKSAIHSEGGMVSASDEKTSTEAPVIQPSKSSEVLEQPNKKIESVGAGGQTKTDLEKKVSLPDSKPDVVSADSGSDRHPQFKTRAWLLKQPATSFTIQLLGSRSESTAVKYVNKQRANVPLWYVESVYKDKPWYVVIAGTFPSKNAAKQALGQLPGPIKKQKPWIRSIKGL